MNLPLEEVVAEKIHPLPWKKHQTGGKTFASVRDANNSPVADFGSRSDLRSQADASYAIHAANHFAELRGALESLVIAGHFDDEQAKRVRSEMLDKARAILAKTATVSMP